MTGQPTLSRLEPALEALRSVLPRGFVAIGALADETLPIPAADLASVKDAVAQRRAEFVAGRWCAHQALQAIGLQALALPPGPLGAPRWPAGALGSITHDAGHCLAVAGPGTALAGIGIDWCDDIHLGKFVELADHLLAPSEHDAYARSNEPARHLQRLLCAKEAVVKAASASLGRFVELQEIAIQGDAAEFVAHVAGHDAVVAGRHLSLPTHLLAWAVLPARRRP